jgi:hypothetical protein
LNWFPNSGDVFKRKEITFLIKTGSLRWRMVIWVLFALENGYLGAKNTLLRISLGNAAADGVRSEDKS